MGWGTVAGAGVALAGAAPAWATSPGFSSAKAAASPPGLAPFPNQEDLNFQTLFAYGETAYGAGEIGEVASTVALIQADIDAGGASIIPSYESYVTRFEALGKRIGDAADKEMAAGRRISARAKYLRSASYYNAALFFVLGTTTPGREGEVYRTMQAKWAAAAALLEPKFERIEIAAKIRFPNPAGTGAPITRSITIPAYYARATGSGPKPTIIINNGSDAQLIDVYCYGAASALERGYNALIFEGPGQGSLLFEHNVPFTPYWQDVVTPLVDYLVDQPEVDPDNLALTGWSFGGVLVMRAAAFEHRLKAVVGDPGYVDNSLAWTRLITSLKDDFGGITNEAFTKLFAAIPKYGAPTSQVALTFLLNKRGEIYSADYHTSALTGARFTDVPGLLAHVATYTAAPSLLAKVKAHILIDSYEDDVFFPLSQSDALKAGLTGAASVKQHTFLRTEGAEYHCAPMAPQLRNEVVFDWLDEIFAGPKLPSAHTATDDGGSAAAYGILGGAAVLVAGSVAAAESARRRQATEDSSSPTTATHRR
jgi:dienelactone hydrolase